MPLTIDKEVVKRAPASRPKDDYFYFTMSLVIAAVVSFGFAQTVGANLIHASPRRPLLVYLHALVFSAWIVLYVIQSGLVRVRKVRVHRAIGWFGAALGVAVFVLGIWVSIIMGRFHGAKIFGPFLFLSFADTTAFAVLFALGVYFRRRPEFHRRLLFVATCALTSAGFGRFPVQWLADHWFYLGVDFLILTGVAHDLLVNRRVHVVYRVALPALVALQLLGTYIAFTPSPTWMRIATRMLG